MLMAIVQKAHDGERLNELETFVTEIYAPSIARYYLKKVGERNRLALSRCFSNIGAESVARHILDLSSSSFETSKDERAKRDPMYLTKLEGQHLGFMSILYCQNQWAPYPSSEFAPPDQEDRDRFARGR